jgi:hypothetical protein
METGVFKALIVAKAIEATRRVLAQLPDSKFYIGRTNDPNRRKSEHEVSQLSVVYETQHVHLARYIEDFLINKFSENPRCQNKAMDSGGGVGEGQQYVYVATWR